jgi:hypothetical protein
MIPFGLVAVALHLVVLHRVDGAEIIINPDHVIALHSAAPGQPNKFITGTVRCAVGLTSGKFIGVIESCDAVRRLLEGG